jgi:hypothetical protein
VLFSYGQRPAQIAITDLSVAKEAKATKKKDGHLQKPQPTETAECPCPDGNAVPVAVKNNKKYPRMFLWAFLSVVFLGGGSVACGLLAQEENVTKAILLFVAALAEASGSIFFFYLFLREISPRPKAPFITSLH